MNHWNDSLKTALSDLYELFRDLEVLQNEFEIDLLRLHSQGREQKKKIEYVQDDLVNQRVDIASNRQEMGGIDDTVRTTVSYTHLRAHETKANLVCRLLLEKKNLSV